jgi:hypothetical protein
VSDTYYYYYYYYFECLNCDCGRDVVLDIRVKDGGKAFIAFDCPVCRKPMDFRGRDAADADGYPVRVQPELVREMIKLVWMQVGRMKNPWTNVAMSADDDAAIQRALTWYSMQIELGRAMFAVVCGGETATEKLLRRGLDFLRGRP